MVKARIRVRARVKIRIRVCFRVRVRIGHAQLAKCAARLSKAQRISSNTHFGQMRLTSITAATPPT